MESPTSSAARHVLQAAEQIDAICLTVEDQWLRGEAPDLEVALVDTEGATREQLFRELLLIELVYRHRRGEQPRPDQYVTRFQDYASIVQEVFEKATQKASIPFSPGSIIDRYHIQREIGSGGFGTVYLAEDMELGRLVAIKVPGHQHAATTEQAARLIEEARAAAQLQHPGIVSIYDVQPLDQGRLYAVMQYVPGKRLKDEMSDSTRSMETWSELFASVADALAYAHRAGFVHRDLSPDNILIDEQGSPYIADFGLALHEDEQLERRGELAGCFAYMSPEQVRGETHRVDGRSDIWALGIILYELLAGRKPFQSDQPDATREQILQCDPKPPRQINSKVPAALERICLNCLAKDPSDRFLSAGDLANALRNWPEGKRRAVRRRAAIGAMALVVLGGTAATYAVLAFQERPKPKISNDILVWRKHSWTSIATPGVLPLRTGDQIRITAHLTRQQYVYVVWMNSKGEISPVYPWQNGDWNNLFEVSRINSLALPATGPDEVWTMEVDSDGMEAVVVLGRDQPLRASLDVKQLFGNLPAMNWQAMTAARFDYEGLEELAASRDVVLTRTSRIDDPRLQFQRTLRMRLQDDFPVMETLLFPVKRDG